MLYLFSHHRKHFPSYLHKLMGGVSLILWKCTVFHERTSLSQYDSEVVKQEPKGQRSQ